MLDSFRNASKFWVVKLLLVLVALSFVAFGVGDVTGLFGRGPAIEVGGTPITAAEVNAEFKREVERLQPMFGGKLTREDAKKLGLMDRTIDSMITRHLIGEAANRLGLTISNEFAVARITEDPAFRNQLGLFDRDQMRRALGRAGISETDFMKEEKRNLIRSQMSEGLSGGLTAPKVLVDPLVRWREERRIAETVIVRDESVALPPPPDAATLEQYYKDHTNSFMAPEFRSLTVLLVRPTDVAAEIEVTETMVTEAYQARLNEFVTPERRQIQQVVLADEANAAKAAELVKAGKDLTGLAKELGGSVVDLGTVEKADLPDELADAVFTARSGAITAPIRTALGWHVAKIGQITPGHTRQLAEVKAQIEQDLRHDKALDRLSELGNKVEDALGGGATLEETASQHNLKVVRIPAIDAQGNGPNGKPVADAPKVETFLDVAFHTDQGTESQLTEIGNDGYFLTRVDQVTAPQPKALAEVRPQVIADWQAEYRHQQAEATARKLAAELKSAEPAAKVAAAYGLKTDTTTAFTREGAEAAKLPGSIVAELFRDQPGAVAVGATQGGWIVARLTKVVPFDPAQQEQAMQGATRRISATLSGDLVEQYIAALNSSLGVKVDRSQLTREE